MPNIITKAAIGISTLLVFGLASGALVFFAANKNIQQVEAVATVNETDYAPKTIVTSEALLAELNKRRVDMGVPALTIDARLNDSAQAKCDDMKAHQYYDHVSPITGKQGYEIAMDMMGEAGQYGENLTRTFGGDYRYSTPQIIFNHWFTSAVHKLAALDSRYVSTGFGVCDLNNDADSGLIIVQHFYSSEAF